MITITNRSNSPIHAVDADTLANANLANADLRNANLRNANLRNANLRSANLANADLRNANLRNADLRNADLRNANLRNAKLRAADLRKAILHGTGTCALYGLRWAVYIVPGAMSIGCQTHTPAAWRDMPDARIDGMHTDALKWWATWRPILLALCEQSEREAPTRSRRTRIGSRPTRRGP